MKKPTISSHSRTSQSLPGAFCAENILMVAGAYHLYSLETEATPGSRQLIPARPDQAAHILESRDIDLIVLAATGADDAVARLARDLKPDFPQVPVILLLPPTRGKAMDQNTKKHVDFSFIWSGTWDHFESLIRLTEDQFCRAANRPTLLMVEDSMEYVSSLAPVAQAAAGETRLVLAPDFETALEGFTTLGKDLVGLISDTRFPWQGREHSLAGISLLSAIRQEMPGLPLLLMSSERENQARAAKMSVPFLDKNSSHWARELTLFVSTQLGLAPVSQTRPALGVSHIQAGDTEFIKLGQGAMGGKARGVAFLADFMARRPDLGSPGNLKATVPSALVLCTDLFESFVRENHLDDVDGEQDLIQLVQAFIDAPLPGELNRELASFLETRHAPLAVRSSSLLEDAWAQPYAGLYKTYMIPNNHEDADLRLSHLATAVKLVWASTFYKDARRFCRNTTVAPFEDSMAVMIQEVTGREEGDFFYPAVSGHAQSENFYPFAGVTAHDGVMNLTLGLGHQLARGEQGFRVSPAHPEVTPQFASARDYLDRTQNAFYALRIKDYDDRLSFGICANLERRDLADADTEAPVKALSSTYVAADDRIRDTWYCDGPKVLTFAPLLKYDTPPLAAAVRDLLTALEAEMGIPVELEFAANIPAKGSRTWELSLLQARPKAKPMDQCGITREDLDTAVLVSTTALGNGTVDTIQDIVYVNPDTFEGGKTQDMAREISRINAALVRNNRRFLLAGPGRWGSSDPWLGIPVAWDQISGAGAIVEIRDGAIHADASHGSHFFNTITAQGIPYITVNQTGTTAPDRINLHQLTGAGTTQDHGFIRHLRLDHPLVIKIDGKQSRCVILDGGQDIQTTAA